MEKANLSRQRMDGLNTIAAQSSVIADRLRPFSEIANSFHQRLEPAIKVAEQLHMRLAPISRAMAPWIEATSPFLERMHEISESPQFRRHVSVERCGTILHPIYVDLFDPDFTAEDVQANWRRIRTRLWSRFPDDLDKEHRKSRYNEFLTCQTKRA